jgi:CDP-glucose 4,6-dehydratase
MIDLKDKNIAITGASGFIGSHLTNFFIENGANVFGLFREDLANTIISNKINKIYGNVESKKDVDYFIQKSKPDIFIHLAAQTQAPFSVKYPYNTFETNMLGTLNILEALRVYGGCEIIFVASSDKAYGEMITSEYTEDHPLNGKYPYDASKSITDILSISYAQTYSLPITIVRHCNVYGIGDFNYLRIVPSIIKSFVKQTEVVLRNNGDDLREYIDIRDVLSAYSSILLNGQKAKLQTFNLGSGDRMTTREVFEVVNKAVGNKINFILEPSATQELRSQIISHDLLTKLTGWKPKYKMTDSINEIINWYKRIL